MYLLHAGSFSAAFWFAVDAGDANDDHTQTRVPIIPVYTAATYSCPNLKAMGAGCPALIYAVTLGSVATAVGAWYDRCS